MLDRMVKTMFSFRRNCQAVLHGGSTNSEGAIRKILNKGQASDLAERRLPTPTPAPGVSLMLECALASCGLGFVTLRPFIHNNKLRREKLCAEALISSSGSSLSSSLVTSACRRGSQEGDGEMTGAGQTPSRSTCSPMPTYLLQLLVTSKTIQPLFRCLLVSHPDLFKNLLHKEIH